MRFKKIAVIIFSTLIVSTSLYAQKSITIPNLIGMTFKQAKIFLKNKGVEIGAVIFESSLEGKFLDSCIVYKQNPLPKNKRVVKGVRLVDIYLTAKEQYIELKSSNDF
ncbi:PASTA domain-containing protein [Ferruginibacter sp.]